MAKYKYMGENIPPQRSPEALCSTTQIISNPTDNQLAELGFDCDLVLETYPQAQWNERVRQYWIKEGNTIVEKYAVEPIAYSNDEIREFRSAAYKSESDHIYMSYIKYKEMGDTLRAEAQKTLWLAKVSEIEARFPYVNEEQADAAAE